MKYVRPMFTKKWKKFELSLTQHKIQSICYLNFFTKMLIFLVNIWCAGDRFHLSLAIFDIQYNTGQEMLPDYNLFKIWIRKRKYFVIGNLRNKHSEKKFLKYICLFVLFFNTNNQTSSNIENNFLMYWAVDFDGWIMLFFHSRC